MSIAISRASLETVKSSLIKDIMYKSDTKSCVMLLCFLTCKYMGLRNLPLDLQYGYSAMQTVLLTPICHISPTFSTPTLCSSTSLYLRTNWLQRSSVREVMAHSQLSSSST